MRKFARFLARSRPNHGLTACFRFDARRALAAAFSAAVLLLTTNPASAAGLQISPISVTIPTKERSGEVWLRNTSDAVLHAQVRVYNWAQADGKDVLTPARDMVASPPMTQINANGQQLVRLVRVGNSMAPSTDERCYRLLVDELPIRPANEPKIGLNFVFRYSLPVFIAGTASPKIALQWRVEESDGHAWLVVHNAGTAHAQLADIMFTPPGGKTTEAIKGLAGYVLPKGYLRLELRQAPRLFAGGGTFSSLTNGSKASAQITAISKTP
ncbi:MAG: molecular chaperone [Candidimonas sp.]|nr:MAG: molecular chaperone [Candidimonas sp.]